MAADSTIGFIGAGNMASSIIGGLIQQGYSPSRIHASDPGTAQLQTLAQSLGIHGATSNEAVVAACDIVVLAVKPQVMRAVCEALAAACQQHQPLVVSIAAGIPAGLLDQWLGGGLAIVRTMPNTPALVRQGATGLFANERVNAEQQDTVERIFSAIGITEWVTDESQLHGVTAVSGSGPAYFFYLLEVMEQAGAGVGLSAEAARHLAIQTMRGAADMAARGDASPAELKRRVMSPGGTTERAIEVLEGGGLSSLIERAVDAAAVRSRELAAELGGKD